MKRACPLLAVLLWLVGTGCRHVTPPAERGTSSFRVVDPPAPPPPPPSTTTLELVNRANYKDAQAVHPLVMPVYPPKALAAKAGAATIGIRVTVSEQGTVTSIRPSMLAISIAPPRYADDFREAVEVAVRQWKFEPAKVLHLETFTDGGYLHDRVTRIELVEAEFDLAFTFTRAGTVDAGSAQ